MIPLFLENSLFLYLCVCCSYVIFLILHFQVFMLLLRFASVFDDVVVCHKLFIDLVVILGFFLAPTLAITMIHFSIGELRYGFSGIFKNSCKFRVTA